MSKLAERAVGAKLCGLCGLRVVCTFGRRTRPSAVGSLCMPPKRTRTNRPALGRKDAAVRVRRPASLCVPPQKSGRGPV